MRTSTLTRTIITATLVAYSTIANAQAPYSGVDIGSGGVDVGTGGLDLGYGNEYDGNENYGDNYNDEYSGGHDYDDAISMTASRLRSAQMIASEHAETGEFHKSRAALVRGFRQALQTFAKWKAPYSPLTVDALKRGIELDRNFTGVCQNTKAVTRCLLDEAQLTSFHLIYFIDHILGRVMPLDNNYYMPYYSRCDRYSDRGWWNNFITDYKGTSVAMIQLFNGNGVNPTLPDSLKFDTYEISVLEDVMRWVAADLNRDIFRRQHSDAISVANGALEYLRELRRSGLLSDPYTRRRAVNRLRNSLNNLAHEINRRPHDGWYDGINTSGRSCGRR